MSALTWRCASCRGRIRDGAGYIGATYEQISGEGRVSWRVTHTTCTADPYADDAYWVNVDQVRTEGQAAEWTDHLAWKNWYHRSDWASVVTRAAGDQPGRVLAHALALADEVVAKAGQRGLARALAEREGRPA